MCSERVHVLTGDAQVRWRAVSSTGEDVAGEDGGAAPDEPAAAEPEQGAEKRMLQSVVEQLVDPEQVSCMGAALAKPCCSPRHSASARRESCEGNCYSACRRSCAVLTGPVWLPGTREAAGRAAPAAGTRCQAAQPAGVAGRCCSRCGGWQGPQRQGARRCGGWRSGGAEGRDRICAGPAAGCLAICAAGPHGALRACAGLQVGLHTCKHFGAVVLVIFVRACVAACVHCARLRWQCIN